MKKDIREKILAVASEEFAKYGYNGISLDKIAAKIGITKPAIYYYFKNKQSLYEEVLESKISILISKLRECNYSDAEKGIRCYIKTFEKIFDTYPSFASLLARELINGGKNVSDRVIEKFSQILQILVSILNRGKDEGIFEFDSPFSIQIMIVGSLLIEKSTEELRNRIMEFSEIKDVENFSENLTKRILKAIKK